MDIFAIVFAVIGGTLLALTIVGTVLKVVEMWHEQEKKETHPLYVALPHNYNEQLTAMRVEDTRRRREILEEFNRRREIDAFNLKFEAMLKEERYRDGGYFDVHEPGV